MKLFIVVLLIVLISFTQQCLFPQEDTEISVSEDMFVLKPVDIEISSEQETPDNYSFVRNSEANNNTLDLPVIPMKAEVARTKTLN